MTTQDIIVYASSKDCPDVQKLPFVTVRDFFALPT